MIRFTILIFVFTCWYNAMVQSSGAWQTDILVKKRLRSDVGAKKIKIGAETYFGFLEESSVIIDKSLFVKRIMDDPHKTILITYPPKLGKSNNLRLLKAFLAMEEVGGGLEIDPTQTHAHFYFVNGMVDSVYGAEKFTKPPLISQHKDLIRNHLGKHPLIEFSWMGAQTVDRKFYGFFETLQPKLVELFSAHFYLTSMMDINMRDNLTNQTFREIYEKDIEQYERYALEKELGNQTEIEGCLQWLSKVMYHTYGVKVVILMDDFLRIFDHMLLCDHTDLNEWQKILDFMKNFLRKTLNENPYLEKAVITGFIPASISEMFDGIDSFIHYSPLDGQLEDFFGLSKREVNLLIDHFQAPPELAGDMHGFYDGYTIKPNSNLTVYSPYSVARCLNLQNVTHFWIEWVRNIDALGHWFKIEKFKNIMESLVKGGTVEIEYLDLRKEHKEILYPTKPVVWGQDPKADSHSINTIFTVLFDLGYLTLANNVRMDDQKISQRKIILRVPNEEVKQVLQLKLDHPDFINEY